MDYQGKGLATKFRIIRVFNMMCPSEGNNTVACYNVIQKVFFLFDFKLLKIMKLVTQLGDMSYKVTNSSVISMSYLDITSKINILLFDLLSHLYNQLHILIGYHLKPIHSNPHLQRPFFHMSEILANTNLVCFISYISLLQS